MGMDMVMGKGMGWDMMVVASTSSCAFFFFFFSFFSLSFTLLLVGRFD